MDIGLAEASASAPEGAPASGSDAEMLVQEVVRLLREGATPEELISMGVPREIIAVAMEMMQTGGGAQQEQMAPPQEPLRDGGLASSLM